MENQVLVVILKPDLRAPQICDIIKQIEGHPQVLIVKTMERVVDDALNPP